MADNKKLINVEGLTKVATGLKGYVDKKDGAMNTRMQAVEGAKHTHDNAEELAKVVDGKVAAWDAKAEVSDVQAAQQAAEGKAAELVQGLQEGAVAKNTTDLRAAEGRLATLEGLVVGGEGEGIAAILADVATLKTAVGDANSGLVAEMDAAEGRLDALDGESGRMATAEGAIDALEGRMDDVEAFETRIAANEDAIEVLKGEGEGSVKKAVADGIATVVANADADFDTLKEVADWIMTDGTNAAGLQTQVGANKDAIAVLNGTGVGSVTKAVGDEAALRVAEENRAKGEEQRIEGLVTAEATRADAEEKRIVGLVEAEATARQKDDEALGGRIDGVIERVDALEGGLYNFHIYYDPEESDTVTFTAYYSQIKNRDVKNKSMKIYQTEFTFDDEQVIRMKNSETTKESTMKSIGYVFLTLYCMYMEKNGSFDDEDFVEFFKSYSNLKRQDSKDYNFGKSFDLLSSDNLDKKDDKNLISINYK